MADQADKGFSFADPDTKVTIVVHRPDVLVEVEALVRQELQWRRQAAARGQGLTEYGQGALHLLEEIARCLKLEI